MARRSDPINYPGGGGGNAGQNALLRPAALDFMTSSHYREWSRMLDRSVGHLDPLVKLLVQVVLDVSGTGSLVYTLFLDVVTPTGHTLHALLSIALYVVTWLVVVAVRAGNNERMVASDDEYDDGCLSGTWRPTQPSTVASWRTLLTIPLLLKPTRYCRLSAIRRAKLRIIKRNGNRVNGVIQISEAGLEALKDLAEEELEDCRLQYYESVFQGLLMALLQMLFAFVSHEKFTLCSVEDVSRVVFVVTSVLEAAKSSRAYESAMFEHEAALHFLSYYKSRGTLPVRIYAADMLSLEGILNFTWHFFSIGLTVYTSTYLLAIRIDFCVYFLVLRLILNVGLLTLLPHVFLPPIQNAPLCVATRASWLADRFCNMFTTVGTRFTKFHKSELCCGVKIKVPLSLFLLLTFALPLGLLVYVGDLVHHHHHNRLPDRSTVLLDSNNNNLTSEIENELSNCPEVSEWYAVSEWTRDVGSFVFSSYRSVNDSFETFNDIFSMTHLVCLLFYAQQMFGLLIGFADLMRRRRSPADMYKKDISGQPVKSGPKYFEPVFPITVAYSFWEVLFTRVLESQATDRHVTASMVRKLMVLTILKPCDFYSFTRLMFVKGVRGVSDDSVTRKANSLATRLRESDCEVEQKVTELYRRSRNPWMSSVHQVLFPGPEVGRAERGIAYPARSVAEKQVRSDKRLFLIFFSLFDRKMYEMSSDRIDRIFELVCGVQEHENPDTRPVLVAQRVRAARNVEGDAPPPV